MIRVLLSLLLLEVCVGTVSPGRTYQWTSPASRSPPDVSARRIVRDVAEPKVFGAKGSYVTTVIYLDLPPLPDSISVGFVSDKSDSFSILHNHVQFSKLSSAFALLYRIDLTANVVQLVLRLGKAHINGTYCLSAEATPDTAYDDFEVNLYAELMYTHNVLFHIDDEDKITFGKVESARLVHKKVKSRYANASSALAANANYLSPLLLEAVVGKIQEVVHAAVSLDDVSYQIKTEIAFKYRSLIAERLKKAIDEAFADVHLYCFNIFYHDKTNFKRIIANYDVTVPTFVLRDVEKFEVHDLKFTFVEDNVHAKGVFRITSPLALLRIKYRNRNDPSAKNHTVKGEYTIAESFYEFELVAKPETGSVEVGSVGVHISGASLAPTQGFYGDERDLIIRSLVPYIKVFYPNNGYYAFANYIEGLVAEGRMAYEVFK